MGDIVVFDIDGVLADFEETLVRVLYKKFSDFAYADRSIFRLEERYGNTPVVLDYALKLAANPNFYYGLPPVVGGIALLEKTMNLGSPVIYLSNRPASCQQVTVRWLKRHTTDPDLIAVCGVKDKAAYLKDCRMLIDFVVEDNPFQIENLKKNKIPVICWGQQWNEGIFPRLYVRSDGEVMLWGREDVEAEPFFESGE